MFIATLVAADTLTEKAVREAGALLKDAGCGPDDFSWVDRGKAAAIPLQSHVVAARAALEGALERVDAIVQPAHAMEKKLLVADMDSTMITVECLDELADYAGIRAEVAAITERAMAGELDFAAALDERVALIAGLEQTAIARCHDERIAITQGAASLVRTMRSRGARTVLVSGGFSLFVDRVAREIGFDRAVSNRFAVENGALTGAVTRPIIDAAAKLAALEEEISGLGIDRALSLAIGDGANDIPMIEAAGLGVAWRARPRVREAADARLDHADLTALLYAQGIGRGEWVE